MEQSCQIRTAPVLQGQRPVEDNRNVSRRCKRCLLGYRTRPNRLKTAEMCNGVVKDEASFLEDVPDRLKTQSMCDRVVEKDQCALRFVPDQKNTKNV